jgi:hypothetical protein
MVDNKEMEPFMRNRNEETAQDQLPRVCEARGKIYRNNETGSPRG